MEKILVLMGLPASGKTTFADNYCRQYNKNGYFQKRYAVSKIDFDNILQNQLYNGYSKEDTIIKIVNREIRDWDEIILDGLFLNTNDFLPILNEIYNCYKIKEIEIYFWEENRKFCLWNDQYRRGKNSEITIKNAKLEKPDIDIIKNKFESVKVKIMYQNVEKKPSWKVFADKYNLDVNEYGKIEDERNSWCLGGTWANCWGGSGTISAETQPTTYERFDNLLTEICPNISFLQYKKLYNNCVSIDTYNHSDYYGGSTDNAYFVCDIKELYNLLVEMKLIEELDN